LNQSQNFQPLISDYRNYTFVAWLDISGFKELMKKRNQAWLALHHLYNQGFNSIKHHNDRSELKIVGIFFSDSAVIFPRLEETNNYVTAFESLLNIIKNINIDMVEQNWMLTTTIAYGDMEYRDRIEVSNIRKNQVIGNAYITAVMAQEHEPKIIPGQCRIIIDDFPLQLKNSIKDMNYEFIKKRNNFDVKDDYYYFYWALDNSNDYNSFERVYLEIKNQYDEKINNLKNEMYVKYAKILKNRNYRLTEPSSEAGVLNSRSDEI
jgi:hypothetical protein